MNNVSFADIAVVSCGTLSLELNYLKKEGFLETPIYFLQHRDSMKIFMSLKRS